VQRVSDKVTVVTLKGFIPMDTELERAIPSEVWKWMNSLSSIDVHDSLFGLNVSAKGKAVRSENDKDDPVLAERVAEARAKMKVYYFMQRLCGNIRAYYNQLLGISLYGRKGKTVPGTDLKSAYWHYGMLKDREKAHIDKLLGHEPD